jgi:multiple sugar transport system permease protein
MSQLGNRARKRYQMIMTYGLLAVVLLVVLFPIYWMLITAVKSESEITRRVPTFFPENPTFVNAMDLFTRSPVPQQMLNSLLIASCVTIVALLVSSMGSYSVSRLRYPGRDFLAASVFFSYLVPGSLMLIPLYTLFAQLGLLNSQFGVGLAYMSFAIPFSTWMLKGYFGNIPKDLEEAALVDGCNRLRALALVILPLAAPGMVASAIFCFTLSWNEFMVAFVFINKRELLTFPVGLASLIYGDRFLWGQIMTGATLMSAPVLVLYFMAQRFIVSGLTAGAVKA